VCGIAGHLAFPAAEPERARRMAERLAHRGPDGAGEWAEGPIALAHRRLSIIDVAGGAQPMRSADGALAVVCNGEIYNYRELRKELGEERFRTRSDTEVLLELYARDGVAMVERLRGMFAFALWDARARRLLLARDRFGEKPLVYARRGRELFFASELHALRAGAPEAIGGVDRRALAHYLELLYVPAPLTLLSGARKLPAGHLLLAGEHGVEEQRWFTPPAPGSGATALGAAELRGKLAAAVSAQLVSDVPVAALLSGGIDSSAVVGLAAEKVGPGLRTYAVGFGRPDDELPAARLVAERFRTDHRELVIEGGVTELAEQAFAAFSEPLGDSSVVPTAAVMRAVAREVKVVLTGDGGDELFAGYDRYRTLQRLSALPALSASRLAARALRGKLGRAAEAVGRSGEQRYRALLEVFNQREREALLGESLPAAPGADLRVQSDVDAALAFDLIVYLPNDLLMKVDGAAMRFGLEARAPLLDPELALAVLPPAASSKQSASQGKLLLRAALGDLLPREIWQRKKRGFGAPVSAWLRGPLWPMLRDLVGSPAARVRKWLDGRAVERAVADVEAGRGNPHQAWALLALEQWARRNSA
jgi:asparagine synthase (glutamine-hydrolysing)